MVIVVVLLAMGTYVVVTVRLVMDAGTSQRGANEVVGAEVVAEAGYSTLSSANTPNC